MGSSVNLSDVGIKLNKEDADWNRQTVSDLLNRQTLSFPGAQPVSFARKHLKELEEVDYYLCEKTDGIRCLLLLTTRPEGDVEIEEQFFVDRKNDYYYIPRDTLHIPKASDRTPEGFVHTPHSRTLLDGELVLQRRKDGRQRLAYLIFDLLALDGENLTNRSFDKRIGRARELIIKPYKKFAAKYADDVAAQPFELQIKDMQVPYAAQMMFMDVIPNLPHGNDGLIFTCVNTPYVAGTDQHILKWKPPHENTVDFKLQIGDFPIIGHDEKGEIEDYDAKPELFLLVNHGGSGPQGGYHYFDSLHITDGEWEATKGMNQQLDARIIECWKDASTSHWRPKIEENGTPRFRDDKKDANHISVVESVLESINDAVTEEDLIESAGRIKVAYKARQARMAEQRKAAEETERRRREAAKAASQGQNVPAKRAVEDDDGPRYDDE